MSKVHLLDVDNSFAYEKICGTMFYTYRTACGKKIGTTISTPLGEDKVLMGTTIDHVREKDKNKVTCKNCLKTFD